MEISIICIIIAIIIIGVLVIFNITKANKKKIKYTEKDKDLILLIKELANIYRKTDEYMKK